MYKKLISFITSKYVLQNMNICQLHKQNKNKYCTSQFGCGASTVHILSGEYLAKRNNILSGDHLSKGSIVMYSASARGCRVQARVYSHNHNFPRVPGDTMFSRLIRVYVSIS